MRQTHKKTINGHINLHLRMPLKFTVDAHYETYLGSTEEEWEYGVDEVIEQFPELQDFIKQLKEKWKVEEISIEEV